MKKTIGLPSIPFKIGLILLLVFASVSCRDTKEPVPITVQILPVKTIQVGSDESAIGKNFPARTKPKREVALSFRNSGSLVELNVIEGSQVKNGQLIARMDDRDFKIDLESKKADYELAKVELARYERLFKKQSIAENEYDTKMAAFRSKEALYFDALNAVKDATIYAPFSGFIGEVLVENHEEVQNNQPIATLLDLSGIEIQFYIPESMHFEREDVEGFEVIFQNYPDKKFKAELQELGKVAVAEGFPVTLTLNTQMAENDDKINISNAAGFTVKVNILFKKNTGADKVIIPVSSVMEPETEKNTVVWILNRATMKVEKRAVKLGGFGSRGTVEISEGLENGEWIVTAGLHHLEEGQVVKDLPEKL